MKTSHKTKKVKFSRVLLCRASIIIVILCSLFFAACELFNAPVEDDFYEKIEEEVAWANAKKITVTVAFPPAWGVSPQLGTGKSGDTREGFAFDLSFTPNPEYALIEWRAYRTQDMAANWVDNAEVYLTNGLTPPQLINVVLPSVRESGSAGKVTINAVEDVTLVPYSRRQPRIVSMSPNEAAATYITGNPITITFAAPLKFVSPDTGSLSESFPANNWPASVASNLVTILLYQDVGVSVVTGEYTFKIPEYNQATQTIIIRPSKDTNFFDEDYTKIKIILGTGITVGGNSWEEPKSFTWVLRDLRVKDWVAEYSESNEKISVSWNLCGIPTGIDMNYRINGGSITRVSLPGNNSDSGSWTYPAPKFTGNNAQSFEIWLTLKDGAFTSEMEMDKPIRVWNISLGLITPAEPGDPSPFLTNYSYPLFVITNQSDLQKMKDHVTLSWYSDSAAYIIDKNITIAGGWTPMGTSSKHFKGKLYGMGRTISFSNGFSIFSSADNQGLLGMVNGAIIQDLTVNYEGNLGLYNGVGEYGFGLIAGSMTAGTISNCTVKGKNLAVYQAGSVGGLVGKIAGGTIKNCRSELAIVAGNSSGATGSNFCVGGLVGSISSGSIINCYSAASITSTRGGSTMNFFTGGLVGHASGGTISNCYALGAVENDISGSVGTHYAGGLVGRVESASGLNNCAALNPSVKSNTGSIGRVTGSFVTSVLTNNIAFSGMTTGGGATVAGSNTLISNGGLDITKTQISADVTLGSRFIAANGWTIQNGKLPGLFGQAVELPAHLK